MQVTQTWRVGDLSHAFALSRTERLVEYSASPRDLVIIARLHFFRGGSRSMNGEVRTRDYKISVASSSRNIHDSFLIRGL
jgi:hypothetical protein